MSESFLVGREDDNVGTAVRGGGVVGARSCAWHDTGGAGRAGGSAQQCAAAGWGRPDRHGGLAQRGPGRGAGRAAEVVAERVLYVPAPPEEARRRLVSGFLWGRSR